VEDPSSSSKDLPAANSTTLDDPAEAPSSTGTPGATSSAPSNAANNTSKANSTAKSSNQPPAPRRTIRLPPATTQPSYLRPSSNISGIDSTVELPLGLNGSMIGFTPNLEWATADLLTGVTELRNNFKLTGRGVKIGIIDTGEG
jgi:hypothetical protein